MLQILGTEVNRLRLAIGCYCDGRLGRGALSEIARSWNDDKVNKD